MPDWKAEIKKRVANLKLEPAREAEIVEELAQDLEEQYRELLIRGATEGEAHRATLAELSDHESLAYELRQVERPANSDPIVWGARRSNMLRDLWQDLRYGLRTLRKNPGFTAIAVLSLALGIGANAAIFQLLNAVRLRTLPVSNPQELVEVRIAAPRGRSGNFNGRRPELTYPLWEQVRDRQEAFSGIFAWGSATFDLARSGEQRFTENGLWVSGDFFSVLGVRPILGRAITREDDQRGCASPVAVISHAFWQREFGGEASVVGRKITLDRHSVEIIGVTPANFFGVEVGRRFDVAVPLCAEAIINREDNRLDNRRAWWLAAMGRLKSGYTPTQASAHLRSLSQGLFQETLHPGYNADDAKQYLALRLETLPAGTGVTNLRQRYGTPLWLLLAIAGAVLLIACANLANLMLARAAARQHEIVVRLALGASRGRIVRQLLTESLLLAALGAAIGAHLAQALSGYIVTLLSTEVNPLFFALDMDWRVFSFTAGLAILTCVLFGLTPALRSTRLEPAAVIKAGGRGLTAGRERFSLRRALVVSQVALSLVLLVGALLFIRSFFNLIRLDAGFVQEGILQADLNLTQLNLPVERRIAFKRELLDRLRAMPEAQAAASATTIPLGGGGWNETIRIDGDSQQQKHESNFNQVSPGYFKTLEIPLLVGRDFDDRDTLTAPKVAIVNETFARRFLNGANPLGRTFRMEVKQGDPGLVFQIVGLVRDTKYYDLREEFAPVAYVAASQDTSPSTFEQVLIRSNVELPSLPGLMAAVKRTVEAANPKASFHFHVFKTQIHESLLRERLMAVLSGFFGLLAALLATIGLYGVISYTVTRRRHEIGIRMALGADRNRIVRMVLREAAILVVIGLAVGTTLALALARTASALLFELKPHDPATFALAAGLLAAVAVAASYLPARRASRVDPMVALRDE